MSFAQRGVFVELMVLAYGSYQNRLPVDEYVLLYLLKVRGTEAQGFYQENVLPVLEKCFARLPENGDEYWYSMEIEQELMYKWNRKRVQAANAKGLKKREKVGEEGGAGHQISNRSGVKLKNKVDENGEIRSNFGVSGGILGSRLVKTGGDFVEDLGQKVKQNSDGLSDGLGDGVRKGFQEMEKVGFLEEVSRLKNGQKMGIEDQQVKLMAGDGSGQRPSHSLYSILFLGWGVGKGFSEIEKSDDAKVRKFLENPNFPNLWKILKMTGEVAEIVCGSIQPVLGKSEILLSELKSEFGNLPGLKTRLAGNVLTVWEEDHPECLLRYAVVDSPAEPDLAETAQGAQVHTVQLCLSGEIEGLSGSYIRLPEGWVQSKPNVLAMPQIQRKPEETIDEILESIIACYPEKEWKKIEKRGKEPTRKWLTGMGVEKSSRFRDEFVDWMQVYNRYWAWRDSLDPEHIVFYQPYELPKSYFEKNRLKTNPQVGTHRIEGWT